METNILIVSHGLFAQGILDSLTMIAGKQTHVSCLCAYLDATIDETKRFQKIVEEHDYRKSNLLIISDLYGGSVHNEFVKLKKRYPFYLVSGLHLSMLLEFALYPGLLTDQGITTIVERSKEYIVFCKDKECSIQEENEF